VKLPEKHRTFLESFLGNGKAFVKLPKNRNSSQICLEKLKIFVKLSVKNRNFSEICPEK